MGRKTKAHGLGYLYQQAYKDRHGNQKQSKNYSIAYPGPDGQEVREATGSPVHKDAIALLKLRLSGVPPKKTQALIELAETQPVTVETLIELIEGDCATNQRSPKTYRDSRFPRMRAGMGGIDMRVGPTGTGDLLPRWKLWHKRLVGEMRAQKTPKGTTPTNATINRVFEAWHHGMELAKDENLLTFVPTLPDLQESSPRQGFLEADTFDEILKHLDPWWHNLYTVDFLTGWRADSELINMEKTQVRNGYIRLEPGVTKTDDGRNFPLTEELDAIFKAQLEQVAELEQKKGRKIKWMFPRKQTGLALFKAYKPWKRAARAAGYPNSMPHDFRRTATRNLSMDGIEDQTGMLLIGHKTPSIYKRYNIADKKKMDRARQQMNDAADARALAAAKA